MTEWKKVQKSIRELAKNWPKDDKNCIDIMATSIERAIPPDSENEDAIKALEYARRAREFGVSEKGALFIAEAQAAYKDFMLWEDAMKGEQFQPGRRKNALAESTIYIHDLAKNNPGPSAKELFRIADRKVIGKMTLGTFQNHVTKARK